MSKELGKGEHEVLKTCAVRHDLTENDLRFIQGRVSGNRIIIECKHNKLKFIHYYIHKWVREDPDYVTYHDVRFGSDFGKKFVELSEKLECVACGHIRERGTMIFIPRNKIKIFGWYQKTVPDYAFRLCINI
tara:strand:- start:1951 stop:2346 length:396 start_codon:yes stop_codon:yes gene_type:complete